MDRFYTAWVCSSLLTVPSFWGSKLPSSVWLLHDYYQVLNNLWLFLMHLYNHFYIVSNNFYSSEQIHMYCSFKFMTVQTSFWVEFFLDPTSVLTVASSFTPFHTIELSLRNSFRQFWANFPVLTLFWQVAISGCSNKFLVVL